MASPRVPPGGAGPRSTPRRRAAAFAVLVLGILGILAVAMLLQRPVMQVYWAVYARAHPMRDYISNSGWTDKVRETTTAKVDAILNEQLIPSSGATAVPERTFIPLDLAKNTAQLLLDTLQRQAVPGGTLPIEAVRTKLPEFETLPKIQRETPEPVVREQALDNFVKQQAGALAAAAQGAEGTAGGDADVAETSEKAREILERVRILSDAASLANAEKTWAQTKAERATKAKQLEARVQAMIASGRFDEAMKMERQLNDDEAVGRAKEAEDGDPTKAHHMERLAEMAMAKKRMMAMKEASARDKSSSSTYSGNSADYKLTKEMVEKLAQDNTVMVTWANLHYLDFVLNWVAHVRSVGIDSYLVGAMDDEILKELVNRGINAFAMKSGLSLGDFGWGSPTFHKMGREKINLIETFNNLGFHILVSDVDTVWLRNPYPYIAQYPEADVLTSSDNLMETSTDGKLEYWPRAGSAANIGIMLFRTTAIELAREWNKLLESDSKIWDQNAFNDLFRRGLRWNESRGDNLIDGYDGKLKIGILPVAQFCSGHTFFTQRMNERLGLDVYVVHATFQFSGTPGKRHRMRERLLWAPDPPEYYDPPGGLLSFDLQFNGLLTVAGPTSHDYALPSKLTHFDLLNFELLQVRHAWAIAGALNRTLVLPELYCGMDRYWAAHDGVIPGSKFGMPFICPLDHILDLEQMERQMPEVAHGPNVRYREHSLFYNPRMPPQVRDDRLVVYICKEGEGGCADGSKPAPMVSNMVKLAQRLTDVQIKTALEPYVNRKVLHFTNMATSFSTFAEHNNAVMFENRIKVYSSIWCCVLGHPGHVWYDFFWDQIPHRDRHNRMIDSKWKPVTGP